MDTPSRGTRRGTTRRPAAANAAVAKAAKATKASESPRDDQENGADAGAEQAVVNNGGAADQAPRAEHAGAPVAPAERGPALTPYPLIALTGTALFPGATLSLTITRPSALRAIRAAHANEKQCVVAFLRQVESPPAPNQASVPTAPSDQPRALATPGAEAGEATLATLGDLKAPAGAATGAAGGTAPENAKPGPLVINGQILCDIATLAVIKRFEEQADDCVEVTIEGVRRVRVEDWYKDSPYPRIACSQIADEASADDGAPAMSKALVRHAHSLFEQLAQLSRRYAAEDLAAIKATQTPGRLADLLAAQLAPEAPQQWELLVALDPLVRLESVCVTMGNEIETLELENKIRQKVRQQVEKNQREYYLKEQLRAIQEELGNDQASEARELREKLERKGMPAEALAKLIKEVDRLERMPTHSAELVVLRNYIDWALALPWQERTEDIGDMRHAQQTLDAEHFGLEKVKERIIEFLAVRQLRMLRAQREAAQPTSAHADERAAEAEGAARPNIHKGPILCLIGPPGVGKTSLGRSIAHALGRKSFRISLGGVHDEAEIRGHRRTYVGALPGRIIQAMKTVGVRNPVIILDEIDKLAADYRGDPSSALLEALDPEQNYSFTDHYLETPYDLSEVFFICTGNNRFQIPRALADRMDIIEIPGYTEEEKVAIGRSFLWEKTLDQCGLAPSQAQLSPAVMGFVVTRYTREAGVRNLERSLDGICRKLALRVLQKPDAKAQARLRVTEKMVEEFLGPPRYSPDHPFEPGQVGVAMGLAWTTNGGALLPVEVLTMPGKGGLIVTGQLGDVMQESARAAYSYIRSRADDLHIPNSFPNNLDLHIHLPEGAVPKEGPSAGITMAIAMISALTRRPVRSDVAMTGEITLRGRVLPIGGLKNKALAAYSVGIRNLLAPAENEKDLAEIPPKIRHELNITLVATMDDVIRIALTPVVGADAEPAGPDDTLAADGPVDTTELPDAPAQSPNGLPLVASEVSETPAGTATSDTPDDSFAPAPPPDDLGETHDQPPS